MSPGDTIPGEMAKAAASPAEQETTSLALRNAETLKKGTGKERMSRILKIHDREKRERQ